MNNEAVIHNESQIDEKDVAEEAKPWIERAARVGYAAKGIVYLLVGGLAAAAALGIGGETTDTNGALMTLLSQPFGQGMLAVLGLGLLGYAFWRLVQAIFDVENKGADLKGLALRGYYLTSSLIHGGLALATGQMIFDGGESGASSSAASQAAQVMEKPFGRWLVAIVGLTIVGAAFYQVARGVRATFEKHLDLGRLSKSGRETVVHIGRFGLISRGVVFFIMGGFLVAAAWQASPEKAKGLGEALSTLEAQPYGPWLLGIVALGLIAYGVHQIVKSLLRQIEPDPT